jgi:tRNA dimethylallyltransferase
MTDDQWPMTNDEKPSLVTIMGPTCVGKTGTAITLAEPLGAEIISADAMQVYRHMDIGTAKPTKEEQARVQHHLIDVVDAAEPFSTARFKSMAERKRLQAEAETLGLGALHERLQRVDPAAAASIHPNDTYRIIRALEIFEVTGKSLSEHHRAHGFSDSPYRVLKLGLFMDRETLYDRINRRVERMLSLGLLEEVKGLLDRGYGPHLKSMRSIGYRHMADYLLQGITWDETVRLFKRDTRRYAKRQLTWFRADPDIEWFKPDQINVMRREIDSFLTR